MWSKTPQIRGLRPLTKLGAMAEADRHGAEDGDGPYGPEIINTVNADRGDRSAQAGVAHGDVFMHRSAPRRMPVQPVQYRRRPTRIRVTARKNNSHTPATPRRPVTERQPQAGAAKPQRPRRRTATTGTSRPMAGAIRTEVTAAGDQPAPITAPASEPELANNTMRPVT